jgi:hypothetical protein
LQKRAALVKRMIVLDIFFIKLQFVKLNKPKFGHEKTSIPNIWDMEPQKPKTKLLMGVSSSANSYVYS